MARSSFPARSERGCAKPLERHACGRQLGRASDVRRARRSHSPYSSCVRARSAGGTNVLVQPQRFLELRPWRGRRAARRSGGRPLGPRLAGATGPLLVPGQRLTDFVRRPPGAGCGFDEVWDDRQPGCGVVSRAMCRRTQGLPQTPRRWHARPSTPRSVQPRGTAAQTCRPRVRQHERALLQSLRADEFRPWPTTARPWTAAAALRRTTGGDEDVLDARMAAVVLGQSATAVTMKRHRETLMDATDRTRRQQLQRLSLAQNPASRRHIQAHPRTAMRSFARRIA
jgi:hypothetical protein